MKNRLFWLAAALGFLASCSSSDEKVSDTSNYMPLSTGNYWVYDVTSSDNSTSRDSLFIEKDTVIASNTYKKFNTLIQPTGFFSNSMRGNSLRELNGKLMLTGNAGLNVAGALPIDIALTDFVVLDKSATADQQLGSITGTLQQDFQGFPLTINYSLKATAQAGLPSYTAPDGYTYSNVKPVKTILTLSITTVFGGFPINLMPSQDVVVSTQYYANGVGMFYANTDVNYQLSDLSGFGVTLPFPQSGSLNQKEVLDTYVVAPSL